MPHLTPIYCLMFRNISEKAVQMILRDTFISRKLTGTCRFLLCLMRRMNKDLRYSLKSTERATPQPGLGWLEKAKFIAKEVQTGPFIASFHGLGWLPLQPPFPNLVLSWPPASLCVSRGCFYSTDRFPGVRNVAGLDQRSMHTEVPVPEGALGWKGDCVCMCVRSPGAHPTQPGWQPPAGSSAGG